jgi:hypothetical protein
MAKPVLAVVIICVVILIVLVRFAATAPLIVARTAKAILTVQLAFFVILVVYVNLEAIPASLALVQ